MQSGTDVYLYNMNEQILLWLDDTKNPAEYAPKWEGKVVWVKSYDEFDAYMEWNPMPAMISFDYMLGHGEDMFQDGIGAAKSVIRKCTRDGVPFPRWRIHSTFDTVGKLRKYIEHAIDMYDLGDAEEEDRQPNTPIQDDLEKAVYKTASVGFSNQWVPRPDGGAVDNVPATKKKTQGRNEPCDCKSGKKFKHCHGK